MMAAVLGPEQNTVRGVAGCCALVAVKRRALGKTRLAPLLAPRERVALVRSMLAQVIDALKTSRCVQSVLLVSPERDAVPGIVRVYADSGRDLNVALGQAQDLVLGEGAIELLVLPGDLPRVRADDIDALIVAGRATGCAIAPDRAGSGTNALYWRVPAACRGEDAARFRFQFGSGSLTRHIAEARRLGLVPSLVHRPRLSFDIDTPSDLKQWRSLVARRAEPVGRAMRAGERRRRAHG